MNRISAIALFAASTITVAGSALAQAHVVRANIPFDFTLNNRVLPAGTYSISKGMENLVTVRNEASRATVMTSSYGNGKLAASPVLVFHKLGGSYFLAEVIGTPWSAMNVALPRSKQEVQVLRQEASMRKIGEVQIALK